VVVQRQEYLGTLEQKADNSVTLLNDAGKIGEVELQGFHVVAEKLPCYVPHKAEQWSEHLD
jgi:hypothetical protein